MRILLDECVPKPLKREFNNFDLKTVREMGWSGTKNGALLKLMSESGFSILLTSDRNLKYEYYYMNSVIYLLHKLLTSARKIQVAQ